MRISILIVFAPLVAGHGMLVSPSPRNAVDRTLPMFSNGSWPASQTDGCICADPKGGCPGYGAGTAQWRYGGGGQACLWFSQGCTIGCDACDGLTQHTFGKSLCNSTVQLQTSHLPHNGMPEDLP